MQAKIVSFRSFSYIQSDTILLNLSPQTTRRRLRRILVPIGIYLFFVNKVLSGFFGAIRSLHLIQANILKYQPVRKIKSFDSYKAMSKKDKQTLYFYRGQEMKQTN